MGTAARRKQAGKNGGDKMTAAQAKAVLKAEQEAVVRACGEEVRAVLAKYGCTMSGIPAIAPAGNGGYLLVANVAIQIKPESGQEE
jgi:hypothetical protein